jgi:tRNA-2-methylthio-N6-dimethylallyladenosine synthase
VVKWVDMGNGFDFGVERLGRTGVLSERLKRRMLEAREREGLATSETPNETQGPSTNAASGVAEEERLASGLAGLKPGTYMGQPLDGELRANEEYIGVDAGVRSFYLETFGCQMNDHDSEKVAGVLLARGYAQVERPEDAGVILYNTCSIREKAAQKVFSRLGEYKLTKKEGQVIGVLGCLAQQEGEEIFERAPWVSLVCGSASYRKLPEMIAELEAGNRRITGLDNDTDETFETPVTRRDNLWRAYITIIEGCDRACSYCVVPFTRGPERSRASASVLEEVRQLAALGYTEVQLLGQTVNSYADPSSRKMRFSDLLVATAETAGMRRVRFTTSHPRDFGVDIVQAIESYPAICNHVHLPVQSGSTELLAKMARTYTREGYLEKIGMLQGAKREISITTDIIVGFPGETEKDFEETLTLLDAAQYDAVFAFKYSPRPNTPSLTMEDAIPEEEKSRRLGVLLARQREIQIARNAKLVGRTFEVMVEGRSRRENQFMGHTSCNRILNFTSPEQEVLGHYRQVRVTSSSPNSLAGKVGRQKEGELNAETQRAQREAGSD